VSPIALKSKHFGRKLIDCKRTDGVLMKLLADLEILAKYAAQVATNEKYGA
jgi:hypothetical protein